MSAKRGRWTPDLERWQPYRVVFVDEVTPRLRALIADIKTIEDRARFDRSG